MIHVQPMLIATKHVCQHVIATSLCVPNLESTVLTQYLCPIRVSCGGVAAKYVRITLPGD